MECWSIGLMAASTGTGKAHLHRFACVAALSMDSEGGIPPG
jgi:hypothetical protein